MLPGLTVNLKKSRDVECSESAKMRKIMEIGQAENKKLQEVSMIPMLCGLSGFNSLNGRVIRTFGAVNSGLIPSRVKSMI